MTEWQEIILEDAVELFLDYRGKTPPKAEAGVPLITAKIVKNGTIQAPNEFISKETYATWMNRGYPKKNDVVLTVEAPLGEVALLKDDYVVPGQRIIMMRGKPELLENAFLKYFFQSRDGQHALRSRSSGTTVFGIKAALLKKIPIPLPTLAEQKTIADILSSLDDKIDLLRRQNQTLETLAQTLFRQWFIEEAQEEWKTVTIGEYTQINNISINKNYPHASIEYLDTGSITEGKIDSYQIVNFQEAPSRAKRIVKHNDVIISTVRPNQKHYGIIKNPKPNTIVSTGFCVLTCDKIDPHFVYIFLTLPDMTEYLHVIAEASTSAYPSLKPSDIADIEFQLPPKQKLDEFSNLAHNMWAKIEYSDNQIRTLKKLRDTLLPKLMSGEVRVQYTG